MTQQNRFEGRASSGHCFNCQISVTSPIHWPILFMLIPTIRAKIVFFCFFQVAIKRFLRRLESASFVLLFLSSLRPLSLAHRERFSLQLSRLLDLSMQIICMPFVRLEFHFRPPFLCAATARVRVYACVRAARLSSYNAIPFYKKK